MKCGKKPVQLDIRDILNQLGIKSYPLDDFRKKEAVKAG